MIETALKYVFCLALLSNCTLPDPLEFSGATMGTTYHVKVVPSERDGADAGKIRDEVERVLQRINSRMSTYDPSSEISLFNSRDSTEPLEVSEELLRVVERSLFWSSKTGGAFDITVYPLLELWGFGPRAASPPRLESAPHPERIRQVLGNVGYGNLLPGSGVLSKRLPGVRIDLGGIAKGYGVDSVFEALVEMGFDNIMVEIGGEVRTRGTNPDGNPWRVGIANPVPGAGSAGEWVVPLQDRAVATSGDYQNYFELEGTIYTHEIDPRNGAPVRTDVASATVLARNCMDADALATACMVLGATECLELIGSIPDVEGLLILRGEDGSFIVRKTGGMPLDPR